MVENPYALRNNDLSDWVNIHEVEKGDGHEYFCPKCRGRLIAVQPSDPRRQWFFRHHHVEDCGASRETAIHLMAKQILVEERTIMLPYLAIKPEPEVYGTYRWHRDVRIFRLLQRQTHEFDSVEDEVWMDGRIPDIVARTGKRKLLIEIVVTHDIDEEKLKWIQERNVSTIKVSLGILPYDANKEVIRECLLTGKHNDHNIVWWVHHAKKQANQQRANEYYIDQVVRRDLPTNTPKPKAAEAEQEREPRETQSRLFDHESGWYN